MKQYLFVIAACAVFLMTWFIVSAATDTTAPVLVSPAGAGVLTDPQPTFVWTSMGDVRYVITLVSTDSRQSVKLRLRGEACAAHCELPFDPAAHGWAWRDGVTYTWAVTWKANGQTLGTTAPATFVADVLTPAQNIAPLPNSTRHDTGYGVRFEWTADGGADAYRLVLTRQDGSTRKTAWLRADHCADTCATTVDFPLFEPKDTAYRWYIESRREGVKGKVRSAETAFTRR